MSLFGNDTFLKAAQVLRQSTCTVENWTNKLRNRGVTIRYMHFGT